MKTLHQFIMISILSLFLVPQIHATTIQKSIESFPYNENFELKYGDEYVYKLNVKPGQQINAVASFGQINSDSSYIHKSNVVATRKHYGNIVLEINPKVANFINGSRTSFMTLGGFKLDTQKSTRLKNEWYWQWEQDIYPPTKLSYLTASEFSNTNNEFYFVVSNTKGRKETDSIATPIGANLPIQLTVNTDNYFDANSQSDACDDNSCALEIKPGSHRGFLFPKEEGIIIKNTANRSGDQVDIYKFPVKKGDVIDVTVEAKKELILWVDGIHCEKDCYSQDTQHFKGKAATDTVAYVKVSATSDKPENISVIPYSLQFQKNPGSFSKLGFSGCSLPGFLKRLLQIHCTNLALDLTSAPISTTFDDPNCAGIFNESGTYSIGESAKYLGELLAPGLSNWYNIFKCKDSQNPFIPQKARDVYKLSTTWDPEQNNENYVQCVTFVFMAYNTAGNPIRKKGSTHGKNFADDKYTGPDGQFTKYANGESTTLPQAGDILVWTDGSFGHVGVVTESRQSDGLLIISNANTPSVQYKFQTVLNDSKVELLRWNGRPSFAQPDYFLRKR